MLPVRLPLAHVVDARGGVFVIYADTPILSRVEATPRAEATCPTCSSRVLAKCGRIVVWHWAHATGFDCDTWSEPVGPWHLTWQQFAPRECREVVIGRHRADLRSPEGHVVELQHSSLPVDTIAAREAFYGPRMVWVWNAAEAYDSERLEIRPRAGSTYATFRWKHPRKSIAACTRTVVLDLGNGTVLRLGKMHPETPCGGWGHLQPVDRLSAWIQSWRPPEETVI